MEEAEWYKHLHRVAEEDSPSAAITMRVERSVSVPVRLVGGLIGRKGEAVNRMTDDSEALIVVGDAVPGRSGEASQKIFISSATEEQADECEAWIATRVEDLRSSASEHEARRRLLALRPRLRQQVEVLHRATHAPRLECLAALDASGGDMDATASGMPRLSGYLSATPQDTRQALEVKPLPPPPPPLWAPAAGSAFSPRRYRRNPSQETLTSRLTLRARRRWRVRRSELRGRPRRERRRQRRRRRRRERRRSPRRKKRRQKRRRRRRERRRPRARRRRERRWHRRRHGSRPASSCCS